MIALKLNCFSLKNIPTSKNKNNRHKCFIGRNGDKVLDYRYYNNARGNVLKRTRFNNPVGKRLKALEVRCQISLIRAMLEK